MGGLIDECDRERRIVLEARWLMVAVVVALLGVFLTGPLGVVWLVNGNGLGWILVAAALLLAVSAVLLFTGSRALVPSDGYRIEADASQQPDPDGTPIWARKELGWTAKAFRLWG
ncbi:hypothetical protein [Leifsonia sp. 2MCAF36]|uniref:hypothetical protein n=1 Tax=Leifsonia sp. 2MCAF36 TaxID=3232988 RepID=UPI003F9A0536